MDYNCIETRKRFAAVVTATLCGIYSKPAPDKHVLMLWFAALTAWDVQDVERGLQAHVRCVESGQFPPKPADVLRHIQGSSGTNASIAWGRVLDAMQRVGAYQSVDFGDPAMHCAVRDLGGWPLLCQTDLDQLQFFQHRFEKAYKAYLSSGATAEAPAELQGLSAAGCVLAGVPAPEPVLLGNARTPQRLVAAGAIHHDIAQLAQEMKL